MEKEINNSTPNSSKRDSFLIKERGSFKQEGRLSIETNGSNNSFKASREQISIDQEIKEIVTEPIDLEEMESNHMINYLS